MCLETASAATSGAGTMLDDSAVLTLSTGNKTDGRIAVRFNNLYNKGYDSEKYLMTNEFSALPKLSELVKSEIKASLLFDRYLFTLNADYLQNEALPYMIKAADDLEATLNEKDDFGFYILSNNDPTIEVAAANFLLHDLVATCNILQMYQERVPRWMEILSALPPYRIDVNDEFRRNLFGETANDKKSIDVPQLLGLFYRNDPIITRNLDLREACRTSITNCVDYRKSIGHNTFDEGFIQLALSSAAIGDGETAYKLLLDSEQHWRNKDYAALLPIIRKMLVQSSYSPETDKCYLNLLPAAPSVWTKGGLRYSEIRGGIVMSDFSWDNEKEVSTILMSRMDITVDIYIRGRFLKSIDLKAGAPHRIIARHRPARNEPENNTEE